MQQESQEEVSHKLSQLESNVTASQDSAAQRICKRIKREQASEFKKKGHERQYLFNEEIKDYVEAASGLLSRMKPASEQDDATVKAAVEELSQGAKALAAQQNLICIVDRSHLGWQVVEAYESDELASTDEDAKHLEKAEKVAEQKAERRCKKLALRSARNRELCPHQAIDSRSFAPGPVTQPLPTQKRVPGPCFQWCADYAGIKMSIIGTREHQA